MDYSEYFNERVEKTETCWLWKGPLSGKYPAFYGRKSVRKYVWTHIAGRTQMVTQLTTTCQNVLCVAPQHLLSRKLPKEYHLEKNRRYNKEYRKTHPQSKNWSKKWRAKYPGYLGVKRAGLVAFVSRIKEKTACTDCGRHFPACCMDFDHRENKVDTIGNLISKTASSQATIEEEMKKCDIVCANCHRIRTKLRGSKGWKNAGTEHIVTAN